MEAVAIRLEAIASRLEAIAVRFLLLLGWRHIVRSFDLRICRGSLAHCISNGGLLDSVRRFLLAQPKGSTPIDAAKRARHVQEHGLYLAMLMADSDLNTLELLNRLPCTVRELLVPC